MKVTQEKLDNIYSVLDKMSEDGKSSMYIPTREELSMMLKQMDKYYPFMIWLTEYANEDILSTEDKIKLKGIGKFLTKHIEAQD